MSMRIDEVAERGGVNRLSSGYRAFSENTVTRLKFIKRAQELGFTLSEIRELLTLRVDASRDRADVRALAKQKIAQIEEKIVALTEMKESLRRVTASCSGSGSTSECPILDSLESMKVRQ